MNTDSASMPLLATYMRAATPRLELGTYSTGRQLTLDSHGEPVVRARARTETQTYVEKDKGDPNFSTRTITRAERDPGDPSVALGGVETVTKAQRDPGDPIRSLGEIVDGDLAIGIVAF